MARPECFDAPTLAFFSQLRSFPPFFHGWVHFCGELPHFCLHQLGGAEVTLRTLSPPVVWLKKAWGRGMLALPGKRS